MSKTIKLDGLDVPCGNVREIRPHHPDFGHTTFKYNHPETGATLTCVLPFEKAYPLEVRVRRAADGR